MTVVQLADPRKPSLPEVGRPGNQFMYGFLETDEYVPELLGTRGLKTFEKMRRSDGMVAATLRGLKLPLLSATWEVQPASSDAADVETAKELQEDLFHGMSNSWPEHLRQVLTYLDLGFYVCEIVWEVAPDGHYRFRKLAPRLQRTIAEWQIEDDGGLRGVKQSVYSSSRFRTVEIEIDKLLVFVNEKEGANWAGKSVLRPAYKHWYIKDQLYRIQAIAADRHGVGIPVLGLPENADDPASMTRAEEIGAAVRAHEQGYAALPFGWKFDIVGGANRAMDVLPVIQHHDRMIAVSVLAQFLTLGERPEGSYALSEDQSSLFMMVERAVGEYVCDVHNRYLLPKWIAFNKPAGTKVPTLAVVGIETRNAERIITALAAAATAGLVTTDLALENAVRELANLPLLTERPVVPPPATPPAPPPAADPGAGEPFAAEVLRELAALRAQRADPRDDEQLEGLRAEARAAARRQEEAQLEGARALAQLAVAIAQREERPIEVNVTPAAPPPIEVHLHDDAGESVKHLEYEQGPQGQLVVGRIRTTRGG